MSNTSDSPAAAGFGSPSTLDHEEDQAELPFASPLPRSERPFLEEEENPFAFDHVRLRFRQDGWTPERQERFIEALAATGCVEHAARAVGKSVSSAYALKTRAEARPFRLAWEAALEVGIKRLSEAALSRAIHGVAQPIYYQGEQVGERRHYDERLTMFLLRYRDPARFGPWIDRVDSVEEKFDGAPMLLRQLLNRMIDKLFGELGDDAFDRAVRSGELPEDWEAEIGDDQEDEEDGDLEDETSVRPEQRRGTCGQGVSTALDTNGEGDVPSDVIPAKAGIQPWGAPMESRFRGNDSEDERGNERGAESGNERVEEENRPDDAGAHPPGPMRPRIRTF